MALEQVGLGRCMVELDLAYIADCLARPITLNSQPYPDVAGKYSRWLLAGDWSKPSEFTESLWGGDLAGMCHDLFTAR